MLVVAQVEATPQIQEGRRVWATLTEVCRSLLYVAWRELTSPQDTCKTGPKVAQVFGQLNTTSHILTWIPKQ